MPLHLLGKKSWNVYNPESIARVRRDEAEARAREAESESHLRDNEAEDRLARLRHTRNDLNEGSPPPLEAPRKKRRLAAEDDTDRDIRQARKSQSQPYLASDDTSVTLFDSNGHIDLVQEKSTLARGEKSRPQKPGPDELGVRLIDAAGRHSSSAKPWYNSTTAEGGYAHETVSKDMWGNDDAGRLQRNMRRIDASDPLAAMKRGVKQLREAETRREEWKNLRERDLNEVEDLARKERKRRRRRKDSEEESLDGFDLDDGYGKHSGHGQRPESETSRRHRHHHQHRSRRRTRSRSPRRDRT